MERITLDTLIIADTPPVAHFYVPDDGIQGLEWASPRISSYDRPEADGEVISKTFQGGRTVRIPIRVTGDDPEDYTDQRDALIAVLIPKMLNGRAVLRVAEFVLDDGSVRRLHYIGGDLRLPYQHSNYAEGQVILRAPDPKLYGETVVASLTLQEGGGNNLPNDLPNDFAPSVGGSVVIQNSGNVDSYPTIDLRGALISPTITNQTTGASMTLSGANIATGETVTIDMKARTIMKGNQNLIATKTSTSQFWSLQAGNNTIVLTDSAYSATAKAIITARPAWGGA
jgi:hypothetical protein